MFCNKGILCLLLLLVNNCYSTENNKHVINDDIIINSDSNNGQYDNNNSDNNCFTFQKKHYYNFILEKGNTRVIDKVKIVVGNNNDDTNFELQHYAKLYIPNKCELKIYKNSKIQVQKDGLLINDG